MWNKELVKYWCEHYYQLGDYELNPFSSVHSLGKEIYISGEGKNAPYIETCDLNWEFDKALKKLSNESEFRRLYLDREGDNPALFDEFCKLLDCSPLEAECA